MPSYSSSENKYYAIISMSYIFLSCTKMSALTAIKYNPHIEALYQRLLSQGKNKMCALGAAMRKLIHLCYGVLKHQTAYQRDYLLVE